jgi:hypothetical protein
MKTNTKYITILLGIFSFLTLPLISQVNSHFNDGGFSQATRETVDPRFGNVDDIRDLTKDYSEVVDTEGNAGDDFGQLQFRIEIDF